jgi:hypothetical protein
VTTCKADNCARNTVAKGLCDKHYRRTRKRADGSYEDRRRRLDGATPLERYENQIDRTGGPDSCAAGGISQRALAEEYGVSENHLRNIVNCRVWKHVGCAEKAVA